MAIPKSMETAYRKLYAQVNGSVSNRNNELPSSLSAFFPMKGTQYDKSDVKLMVIGRSTNGWSLFDFTKQSEDDFVKKANEAITDNKGFSNWLDEDGKQKGGIIRRIGDKKKKVVEISANTYATLKDSPAFELKRVGLEICQCKKTKDRVVRRISDGKEVAAIPKDSHVNLEDFQTFRTLNANLKQIGLEFYRWRISGFFYATRRILRKLYSDNGLDLQDKGWIENILWSNVCPISPEDEGDAAAGNATGELKRCQVSVCGELLAEQMQYYKPTHVLFFTGWEQGDEPAFNDVRAVFQEVSQCEGDDRILGKGKYRGTPIVVAAYPLFKKDFTDRIYNAYAELTK
ncbi:MAG: hypothetical protein Q4E34_04500 [Synergistaceae bacterium]|nr:hypothetical protein [Synergistaceae bacterium]